MPVSAKKYYDQFFDFCPGAWIGNHPNPDIDGNVVVNPKFIFPAIADIKKHRHFRVTETSIYQVSTGNPGIMIGLKWIE